MGRGGAGVPGGAAMVPKARGTSGERRLPRETGARALQAHSHIEQPRGVVPVPSRGGGMQDRARHNRRPSQGHTRSHDRLPAGRLPKAGRSATVAGMGRAGMRT